MANRQYVGARYVPKIFNNNGSNEWVSGIAYETLTIVTYLNNSYTSVKPVPSNAGAPNLATQYWACTGNVGGVVSELTERVVECEGNITSLETYNQYQPTKVLCIGDSYGMKITNNWCYYLKTYMGLDDDRFVNKCTGSSGFVGNSGVKTFYQQLTEPSDKETFTHIIIIGGFNDGYRSDGTAVSNADLLTAINQCGAYIKANFPNAKTYLGFAANICNLGNVTNATIMRSQMRSVRACYNWYGAQNGFAIMKNMQYVLHNLAYFQTTDVTYECVFHPNSDGSALIARCALSYINGGEFSIEGGWTALSKTDVTGITVSGTFGETQYNEMLNISTNGNLTITFTTPITYAQAGGIIKICEVEHCIAFPNIDNGNYVHVKGRIIYGDNSNAYCGVVLEFKGNNVSIWCVPPIDENKTIGQVILLPFDYTLSPYIN